LAKNEKPLGENRAKGRIQKKSEYRDMLSKGSKVNEASVREKGGVCGVGGAKETPQL